MISLRDDGPSLVDSGAGHHGPDAHGDAEGHGRGHDGNDRAGHGHGHSHSHSHDRGDADGHDDANDHADGAEPAAWTPQIVETVATRGEGVEELIALFDEHDDYLRRTGRLETQVRDRYASEIRTLLREDAAELLEAEIEHRGGMAALVEAVVADETDPYTLADEILGPIEEHVERRHDGPATPEE